MKTEKTPVHATTQADLDTSGAANIAAADAFDAAGAPQQIVPDVDPDHPAVDNDPRANTTVQQNAIDFNDPTLTGAEAVAQNLEANK
ncbi:hypothetical protein [Sphingomonas beigongshangi]|uniref:hypothetical protein n=1 Tax=Sphingomonas beigongshangi TaxID=2782540 RepID=UPI00193C5E45|nr:hypothetical protein [Sphingomonas beigongshangi]